MLLEISLEHRTPLSCLFAVFYLEHSEESLDDNLPVKVLYDKVK